jgi:hypothetical protein
VASEVRPLTGQQPLGVVEVSVDPQRLSQYRMALRMAGVTAALTDNTDEAASWIEDRLPASLVLDQGLPRMTVFRLYGLVRDNEWARGIPVLFVGQKGSGGPGDIYLPSDASPLMVAAQAQELAQASAATAPAEAATAVPAEESAPPEAAAASEPMAPSATPVQEAPQAERAPTAAAAVGAAAAGGAVGAAAASTAASSASATAEAPPEEEPLPPKRAAAGRRLDVVLFRVGLVLLILGGALVFLRPEVTTPGISTPPTAVPATPTRAPAASPSPAAVSPGPAPVSGDQWTVSIGQNSTP